MINQTEALQHGEFFFYKELSPGIDQFYIDLSILYSDERDRDSFLARYEGFFSSDEANSDIMEINGKIFSYKSESLIPKQEDSRVPLLLVFGNPAPHSVKAGMFFSYEGNGREHRVWRVLREVGLLDFELEFGGDRDAYRKQSLYSLRYKSPFRLGFISFFSLSSSPSIIPWTGVAGVEKLFGRDAFKRIIEEEKKRLNRVVSEFMLGKGIIIVFQKDAYNALRDEKTSPYSTEGLKNNALQSPYMGNENIVVKAVTPTRLLHSTKSKDTLREIIEKYS